MTDVFATPDDAGELRSSELQSSLSERLGAQAGEALFSGTRTVFRNLQYAIARGDGVPGLTMPEDPGPSDIENAEAVRASIPEMSIDDARARVKQEGLDGRLQLPDQPTIKKPVLDLMIDHAHERREYEAAVSRGPQGFLPDALGFVTELGVGLIDPVNIAAFSIPVIGEARYGQLMAGAAESIMARAAVRAGVGAAQGAVGTIALQPSEWWLHTNDGVDYTFADALRSVALGAGMGAAFHAGFGAIGDYRTRLRGEPLSGVSSEPSAEGAAASPVVEDVPGVSASAHPADVAADLPPRAREDLTRAAIADVISDRPVRAGELPEEAAKDDGRLGESLTPAAEQSVYGDVYRQLLAAGMDDNVAAQNASIVAARYATRAERLGTGESALDLYRGEGLEVRGAGGEIDDDVARSFDQSGGERVPINTPEEASARLSDLRQWIEETYNLDEWPAMKRLVARIDDWDYLVSEPGTPLDRGPIRKLLNLADSVNLKAEPHEVPDEVDELIEAFAKRIPKAPERPDIVDHLSSPIGDVASAAEAVEGVTTGGFLANFPAVKALIDDVRRRSTFGEGDDRRRGEIREDEEKLYDRGQLADLRAKAEAAEAELGELKDAEQEWRYEHDETFDEDDFLETEDLENAIQELRKEIAGAVRLLDRYEKHFEDVPFDKAPLEEIQEPPEDENGQKSFFQSAPGPSPPRRQGFGEQRGSAVFSYPNTEALRAHPDYVAAKAGDPPAAVRLVRDVVDPATVERARAQFGADAIYAPVVAEEATGRNAIPAMLAAFYAERAGGRLDTRVYQATRAYHTGAGAMERLAVRPAFAGEVEKGGRYVIVDDVSVMGSTLAEMANHIRESGGEVAGVVTLVNASRGGVLAPKRTQIREIERRFGDVLRNDFGIEPQALTGDEAAYLLNFRNADALRVRRLAALGERDSRLRAKGVQPGEQPGEAGINPPRSFEQSEASPPFYSAVERALTATRLDRGSADQWLGTIRNASGVKREELEWLGLEQWLRAQRGPVSRQAIADYIRANQIEVREVLKGLPNEKKAQISRAEQADAEIIAEHPELDPESDQFLRLVMERLAELDARAANSAAVGQPVKFDAYRLPGGENYRELLLTLPEKDTVTEHPVRSPNGWGDTEGGNVGVERRGDTGADFRTSHWDEPNVLAHVRFDDRVIDGKSTLHIAEIQSDWHQQGRKKGYRDEAFVDLVNGQLRRAEQELDESLKVQAGGEAEAHRRIAAALRGERLPPPESGERVLTEVGRERAASVKQAIDRQIRNHGPESDLDYVLNFPEEERAAVERYMAARRAQRELHSRFVPDAPFKTTWPELALKRMIRYAAEHGYDRISWDSGATNAARYDLSKQVSELRYEKFGTSGFSRIEDINANDGGQLVAYDHNGRKVIDKYISDRDLPDHVGKDLAEKLMEQNGTYAKSAGLASVSRHLSGLDIKVGGEGMVGFYDKMLPAAANKLVKKFGAKVHEGGINISTRGTNPTASAIDDLIEEAGHPPVSARREQIEKVHMLDITPELRRAAVEQGFPMFQRGAEGSPRGRITLTDNKAVIDLFAKADRSTFMHEMGHLWLDELVRDAGRANVPQALKDDLGTVLRWLKVDTAADIGRAEHEQWAQAFERYLADGKAPSSGLARAFEHFKRWLRAIYRSLSAVGAPIGDDVRGVFDRLLASDREIQARQGADGPTIYGPKLDAEFPRVAPAPGPGGAPAPRGPRARPEESWSLLEFLASRGGIDPGERNISDLRSSLGTSNKFIPGFGHLVRKGGLSLDRAREAAVEAGYLRDAGDAGGVAQTNINSLLEAIDSELRGRRVYRETAGPREDRHAVERAAEEERAFKDGVAADLDRTLQEIGADPAAMHGEFRARVLELMERDPTLDPVDAIERAAIEEDRNASDKGEVESAAAKVSGWDEPDDAGGASGAGTGPARGTDPAGAAAGGAARTGGAGDREPRRDSSGRAGADWSRLRAAERDGDADLIEASRQADHIPDEPSTDPVRAPSAAQKAAGEAEQLLQDILPRLSADERAAFEDALNRLDHDKQAQEQMVRDGAACLLEALG